MATIGIVTATAYIYSHVHHHVRLHGCHKWPRHERFASQPPFCLPTLKETAALKLSIAHIVQSLFTGVSTIHGKYPNILQKTPEFLWMQKNKSTHSDHASGRDILYWPPELNGQSN